MDNALDLDCLGDVQEELFDVCSKWYNIGIQLKISVGKLDTIRGTSSDDKECLREMLKAWLKRGNPLSTWSDLVDSLRTRTVGECRLAGKLEKRRCSTQRSLSFSSEGTPDVSPHSSLSSALLSPLEGKLHYSIDPQASGSTRLALVPCYRDREIYGSVELDELMKKKDEKFRKFVIKVYNYLLRVPTDLNEFRVFISLIPAPLKMKNILWSRDDLQAILKATELCQIFGILNQYWDFLHFELLAVIVDEYGDAKLKKEMQDYCKDVEEFEQTVSLHMLKSRPCTRSGSALIEAEVKGNLSDHTLKDARQFRYSLAQEYGLHPYTINLSTVDPGSVCFKLWIPDIFAPHMILQSESKHHFFKEKHITKLMIDERCVFRAEEVQNLDDVESEELPLLTQGGMDQVKDTDSAMSLKERRASSLTDSISEDTIKALLPLSKENAIVTSLQFLTYKPDRQDTSKDLKNEIKKAIYSQYEAELSPLGDDVYVQDYT